jgi:CPA2 family monovalent cation:H+ antiporter-2
MHPNLLQDLAIILAIAGGVTLLFHRIRQPVVLGYILAGVIVGPNTPPFPLVHDHHTVEMLAELGVVLLMFGLGLHFSLRKLAAVGATAIIAATLEIVIMVLAGYGLGRAFGWSAMDALFLGAILSISSTTIIVKALQELGLTKASFAGTVFGILIVEDILAIAMIALLSGIAATGSLHAGEILLTLGKLAVFLAVVLVAGLLLVPSLIRYVDRFKSREMLLVVTLALCFGVSLIALKLGYSVALGAFLIGAVIAETREHAKIDLLVEPVRDMFAAVFFVAIGMLIDPRMLLTHLGPILAITVVVVVGKVFACGLGSFVAGNDRPTSLRIGMSLAQIGEFSFIIAQLGLTLKTAGGKSVTSDFLYPIAIAVSAVTTLLTPYLIKSSDSLARWSDRVAPRRLATYSDLYTQWVGRLGRSQGAAPQIRRLFLRWALQIGLNLILLTGLLIATAWVGTLPQVKAMRGPEWLERFGGTESLVWFAGTVLSLPLLIAILRKLRAVAMALAELSVSRASAGERTDALRRLMANILLALGIFAVVLWGLAITSAILPPWPVLVALGLVVALIAVLMWRSLVRVYAKAQIRLAETLAEDAADHHTVDLKPAAAPALPVLAGATLHPVPLTGHSPAAGKLIRELAIRTSTGASVVAIDRGGTPLVNPDPDEELRPGDQLYLLGTPDQVALAAAALTGPRDDLPDRHALPAPHPSPASPATACPLPVAHS